MNAPDLNLERRAVDAARQQFNARRPPSSMNAGGARSDAGPPEVPGYTLEREIHRGGQGAVYRAIQQSTGQVVALKLLYEGPIGGGTDRVRFEREIAILTQLRHPHIVAVHDAGSVGGRLFYVMDYVDGAPFDRCISKLELRDLLALFAKICEAVNVAHLRGVIHRDLKPANILIDEAFEPHVVDFGLAKLGRDDPFLHSSDQAMTATGQFVGSLPWSSPEQLGGESDGLDTRVDVYALGVILYQALTGRFPYSLTGGAMEVMNRIRSQEPLQPREALDESRSSAGFESVGAAVARAAYRLDDEIETIILKCLQKDRERRYQTAGELARDLRHYLANEPIEAKRDSIAYVLRKQLRRHRLPVFAALSFAVLIVAALVTTAALWRRAEDGWRQARKESQHALAAEVTAEERRREAEDNLADAEGVASVLESIFGADAETHEFSGRDYTVKQMLDERAGPVLEQLADRPDATIRIRTMLAMAYRALGDFEAAAAHGEALVDLARATHGAEHDEYADALRVLGNVRSSAGEPQKAEALFAEAHVVHERAGSVIGEWSDRLSLAELALHRGDVETAERLLGSGADDSLPEDLTAKEKIEFHHLTAALLQRKRDAAGAEREYRAALEILENSASPGDERFPMLWNDLAMLLRGSGDAAGARPLLEQAAAAYAKLYGEDNPRHATVLSNLGLAIKALGDLGTAEQMMRRSLDIRLRVLPEDHPDRAAGLNNLAHVLEAAKKYDESIALYREALRLIEARSGEMHPHAIICTQSLARTLHAAGQSTEALHVYESLAERQRRAAPDSPDVAGTLTFIGSIHNDLKDFAAAEAALREALTIRETALPPGSWQTANTRSVLGEALAGLGRIDEAEPLLREALDAMQKDQRTPPERVRQAAARLERVQAAGGE